MLELAGYGELRAKQSEQRDRGGLLGVGICSYVDATGLGSSLLLSLTNYQWSDRVAVDDCGNVLNPMLVEGQVRGGIAQGVGQALLRR